MDNPGYIALSRQTTLMRQMDVVANNIANANTPGYRGEHMLFAEYLSEPRGGLPMSYVEDVAVARDLRPGTPAETGAPLDLAIDGAGYLVVETPAGARYGRGGHLQIANDGRLVTSAGYSVLDDQDREIRIPADARDILVTPDGTVSVDAQEVGRIRLVTFANEQALRKTAGGLYTTEQQPEPAPDARLLQGMIEQSNVQSIVEMTRMMELMRAFQATNAMLEGEHERQLRAIRELPRPPQ